MKVYCILNILILGISLPAFPQIKNIKFDSLEFMILQGDDFPFTLPITNFKSFPSTSFGRDEIFEIEKIFKSCIRQNNNNGEKVWLQGVAIDPGKYKVQLIPFWDHDSLRNVWANCFCEESKI
ncbi:MAG: hypothetical protein R3B93_24430 [Bacteroidia bacterium]